MRLFNWIKNNKLSTLLLVILAVIFIPAFFAPFFGVFNSRVSPGFEGGVGVNSINAGYPSPSYSQKSYYPSPDPYAPNPDIKDRKVVQESQLSLLVSDVSESLSRIKSKAQELGGYMVDSNITRPEEGVTGNITVRVASDKLDEALKFFRSVSVKVVSENLQGQDVTDQYVDNEARLLILERNKARFEEIMTSAKTIDEILRVQQEIFSLQNQIDQIKGQQRYLDAVSKTAVVTIYLATDELALPYAPSQPWRPSVVFKYAVRSLLGTLQGIGSLVIWVLVYSVVWVPALVAFKFIKRALRKPQTPQS